MSNEFNEYRRQAEFCEKMAKRAATMESRASWLRLASKWLALMAKAPEDEDDKPAPKNTGPRDSSSSR